MLLMPGGAWTRLKKPLNFFFSRISMQKTKMKHEQITDVLLAITSAIRLANSNLTIKKAIQNLNSKP